MLATMDFFWLKIWHVAQFALEPSEFSVLSHIVFGSRPSQEGCILPMWVCQKRGYPQLPMVHHQFPNSNKHKLGISLVSNFQTYMPLTLSPYTPFKRPGGNYLSRFNFGAQFDGDGGIATIC